MKDELKKGLNDLMDGKSPTLGSFGVKSPLSKIDLKTKKGKLMLGGLIYLILMLFVAIVLPSNGTSYEEFSDALTDLNGLNLSEGYYYIHQFGGEINDPESKDGAIGFRIAKDGFNYDFIPVAYNVDKALDIKAEYVTYNTTIDGNNIKLENQVQDNNHWDLIYDNGEFSGTVKDGDNIIDVIVKRHPNNSKLVKVSDEPKEETKVSKRPEDKNLAKYFDYAVGAWISSPLIMEQYQRTVLYEDGTLEVFIGREGDSDWGNRDYKGTWVVKLHDGNYKAKIYMTYDGDESVWFFDSKRKIVNRAVSMTKGDRTKP